MKDILHRQTKGRGQENEGKAVRQNWIARGENNIWRVGDEININKLNENCIKKIK